MRWILPLLAVWPAVARASPLALTQPEVEALVAELVPIVEEAAGRRFLTPPVVELATPERLGAALFREQLHLLGQRGELPPEEAAHAAASAGSISGAFVGKYGFLDKKLYVVSNGVVRALASRGVHPDLAGPVVEIVLAHELAHALQDQHADLGAVAASRPDGDAVMAASCVVEGHAVWVHERVGERRGLDLAVDVLADIQGYDRAHPAIDPSRFYTSYLYGVGRAFVGWYAEHNGDDALWTLLAAPPAATAMLLEPETYAAEVAPAWSDDARHAVRRARLTLSPRAWHATDEPVGDFELRRHLVNGAGDHALADALRAGWRSRATAPRTSDDDPMLAVEVQLLGFATSADARAYVVGMRSNAEEQLDGLLPPQTSAIVDGVRASVTRFDAMPSDVSAREAIVLALDGARQELGTLWVARGTNVLQVVTVNQRIPDRKLARILDRVFASLGDAE